MGSASYLAIAAALIFGQCISNYLYFTYFSLLFYHAVVIEQKAGPALWV